MRIGAAQINTRLGDLAGNSQRILSAVEGLVTAGAELIVFPELVVTGYPPRDLLCDDDFVRAAIAANADLARRLAEAPPVILGSVDPAPRATPQHPGLHNAALVLQGGRVSHVQPKRLLPSHDVFHEHRWFVSGTNNGVVKLAGRRVGLLVCEDLWDEGYPVHPASEFKADGAELLICLSASPYRTKVIGRRHELARRPGLPLVYVNAVGANDELIFDGGSFCVDARGRITASLPRFEEAVRLVDPFGEPAYVDAVEEPEELFEALVLGVRDFAKKNGLRRAFLGLSGGIDSALVACIAREALGPEWVTAIAIPSRYSDPQSTESARELSSQLGIAFEIVPLEPLFTAAEQSLGPLIAGGGVTAENIQARLRMVILMSYVNRHGGMLLNTSNKTELALGYGTLYADMAGSLSPIGDLTKPQVYEVSRWYDSGRGVIPPFVLERPPSAELRPEQIDPFDYPRISPIVEAIVQGLPIPAHASREEVERCQQLIRISEHKRWQSGIVLKVSEKSFGTGRMMPVTKA